MTFFNDPPMPRFQEPDYYEPAPQYCEFCDCELHEDKERERETCDECHYTHHCEQCGEYSEELIMVAETEGYCTDCYEPE